MSNYEKAKDYIKKSDGIFTLNELSKHMSRYYINKLLREKIIEKYSYGVYIRNDIFEDIYYIIQLKNKNIYFSHNTALYFYSETEKTPSIIEVTTYSGRNTSNLNGNVKVHYVSKENLELRCC